MPYSLYHFTAEGMGPVADGALEELENWLPSRVLADDAAACAAADELLRQWLATQGTRSGLEGLCVGFVHWERFDDDTHIIFTEIKTCQPSSPPPRSRKNWTAIAATSCG